MKIRFTILLILTGLIIIGCNPYKRISLGGNDFYGRNKVIKNIDRYDLYIHQADSVYHMYEPISPDSSTILGQIIPLDQKQRETKKVATTDERVGNAERGDIHIYMTDDFDVNVDNSEEKVIIKASDIKEVKLSAKQKMGAGGITLTIVLGVVGTILLIIALIVGLLVSSGESGTSTSGDSNSGGSNSGSGNSGSGDSGGSGSDSNCYVATMAYGSYEAAEVLVLRQFRDQVLKKFNAGQAFITWYYKNSPGFVQKHKSKQWLHVIIRKTLNIVVFILKPFMRK